ncbi:MAG: TerB N-terminal domain-containing protein [Planctomycetaceae bacterium]
MTRLWKPRSAATANFYGPGSRLKLDRGTVDSPLLYVCKGVVPDAPDASLIESGLPVARSGSSAERLPYWPSYRGASPAQRSRYIEWLLQGRCDPQTEIGYVFLYFYGLERRVLMEGADHRAIAEELLRLLSIYGHSASFQRYAQGLLWTTIWLSRKGQSVPYRTVEQAVGVSQWTDEILNLALACFAGCGRPLPDNLVYHLAQHQVHSARTVIVERHRDLHNRAFHTRLQQLFSDGMRVKIGKRERRLEYFPASATLGRIHDVGGPLAAEQVPSLLGSSQFSPLSEIWNQAIEELREYDRAHKRAKGAPLTAEMYEALPEHLRQGEHPHFDQWCQLLDRSITDDGWTIITVADYASLEGISERRKLTRNQSLHLAETASQLGFALEPDPRITGKLYQWNQRVSVFPATEELSQNVASYHAAAVLLELGVGIAAADGVLDEIELGRLTSHLENQFDLSTQDSCRLEHLRYLLSKYRESDFGAAKEIQTRLNHEQRKKVGEFLVGIAAADDAISPEEIRALTQAYRALGLTRGDLDQLLRTVESKSETTTSGSASVPAFQLDQELLRAILSETEQVTEFLREAMRDPETDDADEEPESGISTGVSTAVEATSLPVAGDPPPIILSVSDAGSADGFRDLPRDLQPFARAAVNQSVWTRSDLDQLARQHLVMLGSAVERINEWSYDRLGDALLVDDNDSFVVQAELLP